MPGFDGNKGNTMKFWNTENPKSLHPSSPPRVYCRFLYPRRGQSAQANIMACQGARTGFSWRTRWSMRTHQQRQPPQGAHHQARHSCHVVGSRHRQTSWACQGAHTGFSWKTRWSTQPHQQKLQAPPAHHQARRSCHVVGSRHRQTSWLVRVHTLGFLGRHVGAHSLTNKSCKRHRLIIKPGGSCHVEGSQRRQTSWACPGCTHWVFLEDTLEHTASPTKAASATGSSSSPALLPRRGQSAQANIMGLSGCTHWVSWRTRWSMRTHQQRQPPQGAHHQAQHSCHVEGSRHRQTSWACQGAHTGFSWRKHWSTQPHQQKLQAPPAHHQARRSCHVEGSQRKQTSWACQGARIGSSCSQPLCALVSRYLVLRWPRVFWVPSCQLTLSSVNKGMIMHGTCTCF